MNAVFDISAEAIASVKEWQAPSEEFYTKQGSA